MIIYHVVRPISCRRYGSQSMNHTGLILYEPLTTRLENPGENYIALGKPSSQGKYSKCGAKEWQH